MTALRKPVDTSLDHDSAMDRDDVRRDDAPTEAFAYDDDVTADGVASLRDKAAAYLPKGPYKVIDGDAGAFPSKLG